jgi:hypothetical protein
LSRDQAEPSNFPSAHSNGAKVGGSSPPIPEVMVSRWRSVMSALRGSLSGSASGSQSRFTTGVSSVSFLPPGSLPASLSASSRPNARLVYDLEQE